MFFKNKIERKQKMEIKKVLVIDDREDMLFLLGEIVKFVLKDDNINVLKAERADEGLSLFLKETPEVIFCDIVLPDKPGMILIKEIREKSSSVKIIAISGYPHYGEEVISAGANWFLQKPFTIKEIEEILFKISHEEPLE